MPEQEAVPLGLDDAQDGDAAVLNAYALDPPIELFTLPQQGNSTQNRGVRTGSDEYVLRTHHGDAAAILYEHRLLQWLTARGLSFAVPIPILDIHGETLLHTPQGLQSLSVRIPGERLNRHDPVQVEKMGAALGELHTALAHYSTLPRPGTSPMGELQHAHPLLPEPFALASQHLKLAPAPIDDQLLDWWREELGQLKTLAEGSYLHLPRQVIHYDFIPNNVLVSAEHVTAVLDFEFATYDARVLDIAIALRNMLRPWENPEPWVTVRQFCTGYRRWISLREEEVSAIPLLIRLRNIWLTLKRVGRSLATGDISPGLQQIEYTQNFAEWLAGHEPRLMDELTTSLILLERKTGNKPTS